MGLKDDDTRYNRGCVSRVLLVCAQLWILIVFQRIIKRYIQEHLSIFHPISEQKRGAVDQVIRLVRVNAALSITIASYLPFPDTE